MDHEGKTVCVLAAIGALILLGIIAGLTADDVYSARKLTDMVRNGADPIAARCAMYGGSERLDCNLFARKEH